MLMETFPFDNTSGLETPDDDSTPNTPQMSAMEHIDVLYTELQGMQRDLDMIHQQESGMIKDEFILESGVNEITGACGRTTYWEDPHMGWEVDEEGASFLPVDQASPPQQPMISHRTGGGTSYLVPPGTCAVYNLPPEILMHIFELCLAEENQARSLDDAAGFSGIGARRVPLTLCHVSRYWRRLAIETQSLWRSVSITLDRTSLHADGLRACMALWSQGSGSADVAINLEVDPVTAQVVGRSFIMGQLAEMLKRCHRLRVNVSDEMFSEILSRSLPRLQTLEVRTSSLRKDVQTFKLQAPRLRTLAILGPRMIRFGGGSLPWRQLTEYRGVCWADVQRHLDIIRECRNLERCTLYPFYELKGLNTTTMPVRMDKLEHLHVASNLGTSLGGFLRCLETPGLRVLTLEIPAESPAYGQTGWPKTQILNLLERSDRRLEKLELIGMDVGGEKLLEAATESSRLSGCETSVIVQPL